MVSMCIFLMSNATEASFHVFVGHFYNFSREMSIHALPIFKIGLSFYYWLLSLLYILDWNPLSDIRFVNIFSHSVGFLPSWWCSLKQKNAQFWSLLYLFFYFLTCAFTIVSKKLLTNSRSQRSHKGHTGTPVFSSKTLIVLAVKCILMYFFV